MRRLYRVLATLLIPATGLVMALAAVALLVLIIGENPGRALLTLLRGALGDPVGVGYTLFYATDYVFAGLAVAAALLLSLLHGVAAIIGGGDEIVSGMALNLIAAGATPSLASAWFG